MAVKSSGGGWQEKAYAACDLAEVLPYYTGRSDVYISTQRFWGWRRIARLAQCGALAVDVDFHKVERMRGSHPLGALEDCRVVLESARLPQPSIAIASGRGLYLLWLHEPIPRQALPRWNACQRELWQILKPLGADRGALDAARVLRLIGTRHSRASVTVEALTPPGAVWQFDGLADEILPYTRAEIADFRIKRAARAAKRSPNGPLAGTCAEFNIGTLWESRLTDLQTLRRIRWFGDLPSGERDSWMFLAGNAMSYLVPPERLERELFALAREVAGWHDWESRSRMHSIFTRAHMAARGERVTWEGVEVDPRYRFRSETIIELLGITAEEQRALRVLISPAEKGRRRDEKRRRAGMMNRKEYEGRAAWRRSEARRMYSEEGRSVPEIASALGVSVHSVNSYVFR